MSVLAKIQNRLTGPDHADDQPRPEALPLAELRRRYFLARRQGAGSKEWGPYDSLRRRSEATFGCIDRYFTHDYGSYDPGRSYDRSVRGAVWETTKPPRVHAIVNSPVGVSKRAYRLYFEVRSLEEQARYWIDDRTKQRAMDAIFTAYVWVLDAMEISVKNFEKHDMEAATFTQNSVENA